MLLQENAALDLLLTRRSQPAHTLVDPAPDAGALETILTAAVRVPDHGKLAPWRFITVRGAARAVLGERLTAIIEAKDGPLDPSRRDQELARFARAPLVVIVVSCASEHPKIPVWEQELSAGAVCMNLLHAAQAMGFAGQWLTGWPAYDAEALGILGVRAGERVAGFVHLGTASQPPVERPRPQVAELVTEWHGA